MVALVLTLVSECLHQYPHALELALAPVKKQRLKRKTVDEPALPRPVAAENENADGRAGQPNRMWVCDSCVCGAA